MFRKHSVFWETKWPFSLFSLNTVFIFWKINSWIMYIIWWCEGGRGRGRDQIGLIFTHPNFCSVFIHYFQVWTHGSLWWKSIFTLNNLQFLLTIDTKGKWNLKLVQIKSFVFAKKDYNLWSGGKINDNVNNNNNARNTVNGI